jgi:hypothetical protein
VPVIEPMLPNLAQGLTVPAIGMAEMEAKSAIEWKANVSIAFRRCEIGVRG